MEKVVREIKMSKWILVVAVFFAIGNGAKAAELANDSVWTSSVQSNGKIFIGGDFTTYNGTDINHIARLNSNGTLDTGFNPGLGANNSVRVVAVQADGKIIIGGNFTSYNGTSINRIARLNADGTLDTSFVVGAGANDFVYDIVIQGDGKILIAGVFTVYDGTTRNRIARLNADGTLDTSFSIGEGANNNIYDIELQTDNKILVAGTFTSYDGVAKKYIARLNADGTLDANFATGVGANNYVYAFAQSADGIMIGGSFTSYDGTNINRIARLNADGTLDESFNPGVGADAQVENIKIQSDGGIVIGGWFTNFNAVGRNRLARLNPDGSLDESFDPGVGTDKAVFSSSIQIDGKIILAGLFQSYNGFVRNFIARVNSSGVNEETFGEAPANVSPPTIATIDPAENIKGRHATLRANLTDTGNEDPLISLEWGKTQGGPYDTGTYDIGAGGVSEYQADLTGLDPNTDYYIRAKAENSAGSSYGAEVHFKTLPVNLPVVVTNPATNVKASTATLNLEIEEDGNDEPLIEACFGTESNNYSNCIYGVEGEGFYYGDISGLEKNTTYFFKAKATNFAGEAYGIERIFITENVSTPTIATIDPVENIKGRKAMVKGNLTDTGNEDPLISFEWGTTPGGPYNAGNYDYGAGGVSEYSYELIDLNPDTNYYIRAKAQNSGGVGYGAEVHFKTLVVGMPEITTNPISDIYATAATANMSLTNINNDDAKVEFEWGTTPGDYAVGSCEAGTGDVSLYSCPLAELFPETVYYGRAKATNFAGTSYGAEVSFKTIKEVIIEKPSLTTKPVTYPTQTEAIGNVTIDATGGENPSSITIEWGTSEGEYSTGLCNAGSGGAGDYFCNITDLTPDVTYYVRATASNFAGTTYGNEVSFVSTNFSGILPPLVTTGYPSDVTDSGAVGMATIVKSGGDNPSREIQWGLASGQYTHSCSSGTGSAGDYVCNMTGLSPNTAYYFRARASNLAGTTYGSEVSFLTSPDYMTELPTVQTDAVSGILPTTAIGNAAITNIGGQNPVRMIEWGVASGSYTNSCSAGAGGAGAYTCNLTDLSPSTTYFVRAKASNAGGDVFGEEVSFISGFVDTVAPVISQVAPVASPTGDGTPDYIFNSNEAGAIQYAGDCSSAATHANVGNNTISFNALVSGTYNNCKITVADGSANASNQLSVNEFIVDVTAPILVQVAPIATPTANQTPSYAFSSDEAGTIAYSGDCSSATTAASVGDNMVVFNTLADGTHSNCKIEVTDSLGNASQLLSVGSFSVDTTPPTLAQVTGVPPLTNSQTPSYTFSSDEAGTIAYSGDCSSATTAATIGNNTVVFNALADGAHSNCVITVKDALDHSSQLQVSAFTIDRTEPVVSQAIPVATPTADNTPEYVFNTTEAGVIAYTGGCASATTDAVIGDNSIAFNILINGVYGDCGIRVTDAAGNNSIVLDVDTFIVDATPPILAQVTGVPPLTNSQTPSYTFSSNEAGTIAYSGDCSSAATAASVGDNTVMFNTLANGAHSNCAITVTDALGASSNALLVNSFTIDRAIPVIAQVTAVPSPVYNNTPSYTFSSDEAGTIAYSGDCSSATTAASVGDNTVMFNTLADGAHSNCAVAVADGAGNISALLDVNDFTVVLIVADPVASPEGGTYDTPQTVTLTSQTLGAIIYYTTNGDEPDTSSSVYSGAISIARNTELRAFAAKSGMTDSDETAESYVINNSEKVAMPIFFLPGGAHIGSQQIEMATTTPGAVIYYTLDGSVPTASSSQYVSPITISQDATIKAIAIKLNMLNSDVAIEIYVITNGVIRNNLSESQLFEDYDDGIISIDGDDGHLVSKVNFNVEYVIQTDDVTVTIPAGTEMTRIGSDNTGNRFDLTTLISQEFAIDGMAGVLKFGVPNARLAFSKPIRISIQVGTAYDGKTLDVVYQNDNETNWNQETTCLVSAGICQFTTSHATYFAAKEKKSSSSSKSSKKKEVKKKRAIKNSKTSLRAGDILYESGRRFSKNANVALYFGKYGGGYYAPKIMKTTKDGGFVVTYKIPENKVKGTYSWYAVDLKTSKKTKVIYFKVK